MKTISEIKETPRLQIVSENWDGGMGYAYLASSKKPAPAAVVFSWVGGWDHVSVSFRNRCPSWKEMCEVKRMFFHDDEAAFELHPIASEYVNQSPCCLHIWKPRKEAIPTPPSFMVGMKPGQTMQDIVKAAEAYAKGETK